MSKRSIKILALLMSVLLLASACSGNAKNTPTPAPTKAPTDAPSSTATDEPTTPAEPETLEIVPGQVIEVSISMFDRGQIPAEQGSYEDNAITEYINEQMATYGVKINWESAPRNDFQTVMNARIAAGTEPDVLWEYSRAWMNNLYFQGVIQPVTDAVNDYSTVYKEYYAENEGMIAPYVTLADNNVYAMASIRPLNSLATAGGAYRKDMFDALGLSEPQTIDDLLDAARQMKTLGDDIVPIASGDHMKNVIKGSYGISSTEILAADGTVIPIHQSDNYKDAMTTLKTMYDEKLIDQEFVVDKNGARQQQLWSSGLSGIYLHGWMNALSAESCALIDNVPEAVVDALGPVGTEYGRFMLTPQPATYIYVMLTSKINENKKQAAITYIDWLLTDRNWETVFYGIEGDKWDWVNGVRMYNAANTISWPGSEYSVLHKDSYIKDQYAKGLNEESQRFLPLYAATDRSLMLQFSYPVATVIPFDFTEELYVTFKADFQPRWDELETRIITDKNLSVEDGIALIEKEFVNLGGPAAWAAKNEWYAANKELFQNFVDGFNSYAQGMIADLK